MDDADGGQGASAEATDAFGDHGESAPGSWLLRRHPSFAGRLKAPTRGVQRFGKGCRCARPRPYDRLVPSVLVVEDDDAIAEPLVRALGREGYEVAHVTSGEAALA